MLTSCQITKNLAMVSMIFLILAGFSFNNSSSTPDEFAYPAALDSLSIEENNSNKLELKKEGHVSFDLTKDESIEGNPYLVILEIRDKDNLTIDLRVIDGSVLTDSGHERISLTPSTLGEHELRVFLVNSLDDPRILSRIMSIDFEVVSEVLDEVEPAGYTFLVYMVGSTLESRGYFATEDLKEMMKVGSSEAVNIIVETGGAANATDDNDRFIDFTKVQRHKILADKTELLEDFGTQNMGDSKTLKDFLVYGMTEFPAEKYVIVLWDDGGGINGFGTDSIAQDSLTLTELESAFSNAKMITKKDFELIGFDACLMGSFEVITRLDNYGRFMVSSEDLEPSWGWDYQSILNSLSNNPDQDGASLGKTIANTYIDHIKEKEAQYQDYNSSNTLTISLIDLKNASRLESAIIGFSSSLDKEIKSIFHAQLIAKTLTRTERFGIGSVEGSGHIDLYHLVQNLEPEFPELKDSANRVYAAINETVIYAATGESRSDSHGVSIYLPLEEVANQEEDGSHSDEILEQTLPNWRRILTNYKTWLEADLATPDARTFGYSNEKFYGITQTTDVYKFKVYVTKEVVENTAAQLISYTEDNISIDSDKKFEYPYREDLISFCNGVECIPASMYIYHTATSKFAIFPAWLEGKDIKADVLMIYKIQSDSSFEFIGAWPGFDEEGNASRELWPLQTGDKIHTSYFQFDIRNGDKYNKVVDGEVIEVTDNFGPGYHAYEESLRIFGSICDYSDNCSASKSFAYGGTVSPY